MDRLNLFRREAGREGLPFRVFVTEMGDVDMDMVRRYTDLGVTDLIPTFRNMYSMEEDSQTLEDKIGTLRRFADQVLARL